MSAGWVYRCDCGWETRRYDEIDGHEDQLEPGHLVSLTKTEVSPIFDVLGPDFEGAAP